jgi:hypothetical protein
MFAVYTVTQNTDDVLNSICNTEYSDGLILNCIVTQNVQTITQNIDSVLVSNSRHTSLPLQTLRRNDNGAWERAKWQNGEMENQGGVGTKGYLIKFFQGAIPGRIIHVHFKPSFVS